MKGHEQDKDKDMRIEKGKYYVSETGFYHCQGEDCEGERLYMEEVATNLLGGVDVRMATLMREVCEKRMVECSQEQYETAERMALEALKRLADYNNTVFRPLWEARKEEEERRLSAAETEREPDNIQEDRR